MSTSTLISSDNSGKWSQPPRTALHSYSPVSPTLEESRTRGYPLIARRSQGIIRSPEYINSAQSEDSASGVSDEEDGEDVVSDEELVSDEDAPTEIDDCNVIDEIMKYEADSSTDEWNYITLGNPMIKLNIPDEDMHHFWNLYSRMLEGDQRVDMAERIPEYTSVFFEVRLKSDSAGKADPGLELSKFVGVVREVIANNIESEVSTLAAVLTSQFHHRIYFPYVRIKFTDMESVIYPAVTSLLEQQGYFPKSIIVYEALKGVIPLMGSMRESDAEPWSFTTILDDVSSNKVLTPIDLLFADGLENTPSAPYLFSLSYAQVLSNVKQNLFIETPSPTSNFDVILVVDKVEIAAAMLELISKERFTISRQFKEIGQALYSATSGEKKGLIMWKNATAKAGVDNDICDSLYPGFFLTTFTVTTLAWYARLDDPEGYDRWHRKWITPAVELSISYLHTDVCYAFHRIYWLDYICAGVTKNVWYKFGKHTWSPIDCGVDIKKTISQELVSYYARAARMCMADSKKVSGDEAREELRASAEKYKKLVDKLKTQGYKTAIYKESMEHFYDAYFSRKLDTNPNLFGLLNGVIEIDGDNAIFRDGKPDDYLTKYAPIAYDPNLTWDDPGVKEVMKWMRQLFITDSLIDYALKNFASYIKGRNSDKNFTVWLGPSGNNSKSTLIKLFETWGPYCIKFSSTVLTGGRSRSSSPTPELARAAGTRIAFVQEPEGNKDLNAAVVKEQTGGDSFYARFLNDNGGEVQSFHKLVLVGNSVPSILNSDKAVKNRLKIMPFYSIWELDAPPTEEQQFAERRFPMDITFESRLPELAPKFLWILVQYFPRYINEGLVEPPEVKEAINKYWEQHDAYAQFFMEHYEEVPEGENGYITVREVIADYRNWFTSIHKNAGSPDNSVLLSEMERVIGRKAEGGVWYGIRRAVRYASYP